MNVVAILIIFLTAQETISTSRFALRNNVQHAPLALIKRHDASRLELAIPVDSTEYWEYAKYPYDELQDDEFVIACPARSNYYDERTLEEKWKETNNISEHSKLFLLDKYADDTCHWKAIPSIEKVHQKDEINGVTYCNDSKAELYNVGFPVLLEKDGTGFQFIPIYKICYSDVEGEGTLYTVHRIESPSLLLKEVWEYNRLDAKELFECSLDKKDDSEQSLYVDQYAYQFVGIDDMPTKVWESTTQFHFNYTPIIGMTDLMTGMITVDNFIRLYSKATNKPLTLYSGVYQKTANKEIISCAPGLCSYSTVIKAFWRIIKDDAHFATLIVTQYTKTKCFEQGYICHDGRIMVKEYKKGGCTYICPLTNIVIQRLKLPNNDVMDRLDLPPLEITGHLNLTFPRKMQTDSSSDSKSHEDNVLDETQSKDVSIFDFFKEATFKNALNKADSSVASKVHVHTASPGYDHGRGKSGGGGGGTGIWNVLGLGGLMDMSSGGGGGWSGGGGGGAMGGGGGGGPD